MFFLDVKLNHAEGFMGTILKSARSLFYWISELIYKFVIVLYQLFEDIATARLLDNELLTAVIRRVGVVLGIIMLLVVIFDFIQLLLEPDKMLDKEKGMFSVIKRILIVLVALGISTFVFEFMFQFQNYVIENKILYKVILPVSDTKVETDKFGKVLAARTFTAFYNVDKDLDSNLDEVKECEDYNKLLVNRIAVDGDFFVGNYCLNDVVEIKNGNEKDEVFVMEYNFLLQVALGAGLAYLFINYVIQVGVRLIQLTVLQVVSPVFIVGYLSPKKDNMFSKWWKVYFSTYIDIFLRVIIIYFIIYLSSLILDNFGTGPGNNVFWDSIGTSSDESLVMIAMILALLTFAKKAPELIKNLLPAGASGLNLGFASPKGLFGAMVGGAMLQKGLSNIGKRGYGAAAVGFNAWGKNTRKALGNALFAKEGERGKAWGRAAGTLFFGGLGGMRRGLMTTDKAGRRQAAENAYAARQSMYKMRDLGYGTGVFGMFTQEGREAFKRKVTDIPRGWLGQDQYIEDLADMKDLSIDSMRQQIMRIQEEHGTGGHSVSKSKSMDDTYIVDIGYGPVAGKLFKNEDSGKYELRDSKGLVINGVDKDGNSYSYDDINAYAVDIANLQGKIGKAQADSKKLHQKAEEQKQGKK